MFDKFHSVFTLKSKVLCDSSKYKHECLFYNFILKCHLTFGFLKLSSSTCQLTREFSLHKSHQVPNSIMCVSIDVHIYFIFWKFCARFCMSNVKNSWIFLLVKNVLSSQPCGLLIWWPEKVTEGKPSIICHSL